MNLKSLASTVFAAAALILGATSAKAAYYVGSWDPPYGAPFTNLGWNGTVGVVLPSVPPCSTNGNSCIAGAYVDTANVSFYDTVTSAALGSITWTRSELTNVPITNLKFSGSNPVQIETGTGFGEFVYKSPSLASGVNPNSYVNFGNQEFSLQFVIAKNIGTGTPYSGPVLNWRRTGCEFECQGGSNDLVNFQPTNFVISPVPEPTTWALSLCGLATLVVATRRRQKATRSTA